MNLRRGTYFPNSEKKETPCSFSKNSLQVFQITPGPWLERFFRFGKNMHEPNHSGCLDPKKFLSAIDAPPGVPGMSKNHIFFSQMKLFSFCAKIAPKRHKLQKTIKIKEKMSKKTPVFLDFFKYSSN